MKKILLTLLLGIILLGCSNYEAEEKPTTIEGVGPETREYSYIHVDGHVYLYINGPYRLGLAHSGTCPCWREMTEEIISAKRDTL